VTTTAGLLLIGDGEGRRAALVLSVPLRVERAAAVHHGDDGAPEVATVAGRVVAARSLCALLGWTGVAETAALDFGAVCLLSPEPLGVVRDAQVEAAGGKLWWRAPEGEIIPALDLATDLAVFAGVSLNNVPLTVSEGVP
jgi:hypothetical protein